MCYIYKLENGGEVFYVGRTTSLDGRLKSHKKTYGENISMSILEECDIFGSNTIETKWINHYISIGAKLKNKNIGNKFQQKKEKLLLVCIEKMKVNKYTKKVGMRS